MRLGDVEKESHPRKMRTQEKIEDNRREQGEVWGQFPERAGGREEEAADSVRCHAG